MSHYNELTPSFFLKHCTSKAIFVYISSIVGIYVPVRVRKSELKKAFQLTKNDINTIRYVETPSAFYISLIH